MWLRLFSLLMVGLLVVPAFAQDSATTGTHSVSFDGFRFSYDEALAENVNIWRYPGDPVAGAGAGFSDAANTIINLYDAFPAPESFLDGRGGIRVYAISDLAQYDFMQAVVDDLQTLITEQPDLSAYESSGGDAPILPFLPVPIHGLTLRARAEYVETEQVQGIRYIASSPTMDAAEYFVSSSFWLAFQGISADSQHYVSAVFPLNIHLFPEVPPQADLPTSWDNYVAQSATNLDAAEAGDFTPSLDLYDQLIESFSFAN